ncbi:putative Cell division cycle protein [Dioscorea sansibarensis]
MKESELRRCQIHDWYPLFKPHTIKTLFHPLSDSFVRYLLGQPDPHSGADPPRFLLPRPVSGLDPLPRTTARIDPTSSLSPVNSDSDSDDDRQSSGADDAPSFPDLEAAVTRSIADLGGAVLPKLNWSAPKDATWISADGSLRCTSFSEIALLLRSSDSIAHDLSEALASCSDASPNPSSMPFCLALRKWYPSLRPEMEFRCFVRGRRLIAISQREVTTFYPVLPDRKHEIQPLIERFFDEVVRERFGSEDYTVDVYVTSDGRVKIVDFNPWGAFTLPLMFEWDELGEQGFGTQGVEFRVVEGRQGVRPGLKTAVPYDYLDTGEGSGWDQFLKRADAELRKQAQDIGNDHGGD